ncbi:aldehyde dehydrogenase family protein [Streptomyces sp. NPDC026672]|uniref:aldehyde dehydrogenase family protein n=1 Tax=unclassified Streptomyces TaxID=2593676 RepID=UPI003407F42F
MTRRSCGGECPIPEFTTGRARQLPIDGAWVDAPSGETVESVDPTIGRALPPLARGAAADVGLAVAAARRAFEGPWCEFRPRDRARVLHRPADLIEARAEEDPCRQPARVSAQVRAVTSRAKAAMTTATRT